MLLHARSSDHQARPNDHRWGAGFCAANASPGIELGAAVILQSVRSIQPDSRNGLSGSGTRSGTCTCGSFGVDRVQGQGWQQLLPQPHHGGHAVGEATGLLRWAMEIERILRTESYSYEPLVQRSFHRCSGRPPLLEVLVLNLRSFLQPVVPIVHRAPVLRRAKDTPHRLLSRLLEELATVQG
eukprot:scaffold1790_cov257-Pinguiococcus_pyrenoidosus.AAC.48